MIAVIMPSQRSRPPCHRACTLSRRLYVVLSRASLWPCPIFRRCAFFLEDSEYLTCWGRVAFGQFVHAVWGSSPLAWKCAWGVRFLQVGHVRYSVSAVGMYHHPYSWCGRWSCGNRCWGMRIGKVLCSMVLRSALSGIVSKWVARATWALSCHPRTCIRNSRWPPSTVFVVYYEWIKREPKIRGIYECRCDERLQTKTKKFTRLPYPGLVSEVGSRGFDSGVGGWWALLIILHPHSLHCRHLLLLLVLCPGWVSFGSRLLLHPG